MDSKRQRRVLLSAIACSPYLGSEDGVGWQWALQVQALGNEVTVITRRRFQADIERHLAEHPQPALRFVYVDRMPGIDYTGTPSLPSYAYIYLWQWLAYREAKRLHAQQPFDLVQHVTFAGIRLPSFMGGLGIPFLYGPVGGGEETPAPLLRGFPFKAKAKEWLRMLSNRLVRFDPFMRLTMGSATVIGLTTADSRAVVPARWHAKTVVAATIGVAPPAEPAPERHGETIKVLYAGRFIFWKGMQLGLAAFAQAARENPRLRLQMVGDGPAAGAWRAQAQALGIAERIDWKPWVSKQELQALYRNSDLFLFPSLHDSGGMVVLEAASQGLPVLCLDIGGPGNMVCAANGVKVAAHGRSETQVIEALSKAMCQLSAEPEALRQLGRSAVEWAKNQGWDERVRNFYSKSEPLLAQFRRDGSPEAVAEFD